MENYNIIDNLLLIYGEDEGELKIYLKRKTDAPYKGYWILPSKVLDNKTTLEENNKEIFEDMTKLNRFNLFQSKSFSNLDRNSNERVIGMTFVTMTDIALTQLKNESKDKAWFKINELPKLGFDHEKIINEVTEEIRKKIIINFDDMLLEFFPSDFTLPELQNFYENVSGKTIDRRNFHKKFVNQDLVINTGIKTSKGSGRPGALYKFNFDKMRGKRL